MNEKKDEELFEEILKNQLLLAPAKEAIGKDIVLIIGMSGDGKTTSAIYLAGNEMKEAKIKKQNCVVSCNEKLAEKIGHDSISKTNVPEFYALPNSDVLFADFPGFEDNRGVKTRIEASLSIELVLKKTRSIKGIIVVISADRATNKRAVSSRYP